MKKYSLLVVMFTATCLYSTVNAQKTKKKEAGAPQVAQGLQDSWCG